MNPQNHAVHVDAPPHAGGGGANGHLQLQNLKLVGNIGDGRTIEIPLNTGSLRVQSNPRASAESQNVESKNYVDIDNMRGWLLTVATLFLGMAFTVAAQPPAWLSEPKDWFHALVSRGVDSATRKQAQKAFGYVYLNTLTFSTSLAMVIVLLLKVKYSTGRNFWILTALAVLIGLSIAVNFVMISVAHDWRVAMVVMYTIVSGIVTVICCSCFVGR